MDQNLSPSSGMIAINVWLAGRSYRIRIRPEEEETVRRAVKQADEKVTEMRRHYAARDDQDFVAMVLLTYATDTVTEGHGNLSVRQKLEEMTGRIDRVLDDDNQP